MITVITDARKISQLHKQFHKRLDVFLTEKIDCWVGYPSGSFPDTVRYSSELNIWISHAKHDSKYWNGFGVGKPVGGKGNSLNGEINFPYQGIHRRIAGVFAEEEDGSILILHRGRIGGGKPGIGKTYFKDNFRGDTVTAIDGDTETQFCLVGELYSDHFPLQVSNFIKEIYRVKQIDKNTTGNNFAELNNFNFREEHFGQTDLERKKSVSINRTHGIVVNALATELVNRGYRVGNDSNRDLFIHTGQKIKILFEIKTSSSTQNIYSAVGQLIVYSIPIKGEVGLVIVLPERLNGIVSKRLLLHGIKPLYYSWIEGFPIFTDLDRFLESS